MSVLWWLVIVNLAVVVHELGHYLLARWQGVGVTTFSVGFGPVLARKQWRGTEWRISALPLGGYVQIEGMVEDEPQKAPEGESSPVQTGNGNRSDQKQRRGYAALPALGKVAILLAGPVFNLALAWLMLSGLFASQGVAEPVAGRVQIAAVSEGSRAQQLGLRGGDMIVGVGGESLAGLSAEQSVERVIGALGQSGEQLFWLERGEKQAALGFDWEAERAGERQLLGVQLAPDRIERSLTPLQASAHAGGVVIEAVPQVISAFAGLLRSMLSLDVRGNDDVVGPVGTVQIVGQMAEAGPLALLAVAAMINISLGLFNLLPVPFLDGGRILLVGVSSALQAVRGRPLAPAQEQALIVGGFFFMLLLMAFVIFRDVFRLVG